MKEQWGEICDFLGVRNQNGNNRGRKGVAVWGQWQSEVILILITRGTCEKKKDGEGLPEREVESEGARQKLRVILEGNLVIK